MPSFPQPDDFGPTIEEIKKNSLFGQSLEEIGKITSCIGLDSYRSRQIWHALYRDRISSIDQIATLPKSARQQLGELGYAVGLPEIAQTFQSSDGTERYLVACADREMVETVWMPNGDDGEMGDGSDAAAEEEISSLYKDDRTQSAVILSDAKDLAFPPQPPKFSSEQNRRATICVSSQVGCAVNCQFCLTAKLGIRRNLTAGEIAGQVVAVLNRHKIQIGRDRINLVFMGMGEPFLNYDNFIAAVRLLVEGVGIPESRMTVSTSGIVPGIERFAKEKLRPKFALSLNAPNDRIREAIMPITRKWNISDLLMALGKIPMRPRECMTFEYVLLGGVNDRLQDARELAALLRASTLPSKINLIVWNPGPGTPYKMPVPEDVAAFQQHLIASGIPAFLRRPRGRDIYAACGQLKRTVA